MEINNKSEIKSQILNKKSITIPQIQQQFNLNYLQAKTIVNELIAEDSITYKGGIVYEICKKEKKDFDELFFKNSFKNEDDDESNPFKRFANSNTSSPYSRNGFNKKRITFDFIRKVYELTPDVIEELLQLDILFDTTIASIIRSVVKLKKEGALIFTINSRISETIEKERIKFELIQGLIKQNNFKTKKDWVAKMKKECDFLKIYVPTNMIEDIDNTYHEFKDYSLAIIKSLKKMLDDDE